MDSVNPAKKALSLLFLVAGVALLGWSLAMDCMGGGVLYRHRGAVLIAGAIVFFAGLYLFPTLAHHRDIVNVIFLFPLLFTFGVTVIIPLLLGIFYSMTDWTGIRYTQFVGLANYAQMFHEVSFLWSLLITVLFVVFNMVLVNLVGFALALLCTSRLKGVGFFRAAYFLPNLIGGIVLGYVWQFVFNNVLVKVTGASLLTKTPSAFAAIIVVYIWHWTVKSLQAKRV